MSKPVELGRGVLEMNLRENLAAMIRAYMRKNHLSLTKLADELGISRNSLYDYRNGEGNPTLLMLEHIADKMEISPAALVAGMVDLDQLEIVLLLLDMVQSIAELPEEDRLQVAELFLEMVRLWKKK